MKPTEKDIRDLMRITREPGRTTNTGQRSAGYREGVEDALRWVLEGGATPWV